MTSSVRRATPSDIPALVALNKGLFTEDASARDPFRNPDWSGQYAYFTDLIADGRNNVAWVADVEERVVGYLVGRLRTANNMRPLASAELESMFVDVAHRNAGVGASLVEKFLSWATQAGAGRVTVEAYCENVDGIRFYERLGLRQRAVTLDMAL